MDDLYRLLRTGHLQAQGIVDTVTDPLLILDDRLCVVNASRSFFSTFHVDRYETIGRPLFELGDGQWDIPELRTLLADVIPKTTAVVNYQVDHDFPQLGQRSMLITARTLHHPDHNSRMMLVSITDATDNVQRAAQDMLFSELAHRMKNLLSVTQSLARQTRTQGRTAEEFRHDFLGRFQALVEAHDLAFSPEGDAGLMALVERVLSPYSASEGAVVIQAGPEVRFKHQVTQSFSLIVHELATNAAKYGALSKPDGSVHVTWAMEPDHRLALTWVETGGPPVTPPAGTGYGTKLIESAVNYTLGGELEQTYEPAGLRTKITFPLA